MRNAAVVFSPSKIHWNRRTFAPSIQWNIGTDDPACQVEGFQLNQTCNKISSPRKKRIRTPIAIARPHERRNNFR